MTSYTLTDTVTLATETCFSCAVVFALPAALLKARRQDQGSFYCPNGHGQHYTESEAARLRRELDANKRRAERAEASLCAARDQLDAAERSRSALKGVVTRQKRRAAAGVCPCCNRSFQALSRHMAAKHPDYATAEATS